MTTGELILMALSLVQGAFLVLLWVKVRGITDQTGQDTLLPSQKAELERLERAIRDEIGRHRQESAQHHKDARGEIGQTLKTQLDIVSNNVARQLEGFSLNLQNLSKALDQRLDTLRTSTEQSLLKMQAGNELKLDQMRQTVDEKLQGTLEKRLGESFKLVSERLEQVHKGLGDMQNLATGVGDLKKVLTNVKTRGTWGEMQLKGLLEQILTPQQYEENVATAGTSERVEFAIKLPGGQGEGGAPVWLPVDSKFPIEDYQRLVDAPDAATQEEASKALEVRVKGCAKDIHSKYIAPPLTTDFAVMYLPLEGLYAEVARRSGLLETLQREYRVNVAGPTTFAAILNSLQMGFKTLAIQKRSSEVWQVLGAVKTEFGKFNEVLDKVHKKLEEASSTIESANVRTRAIERKLRDVQALPENQSQNLLPPTDVESA
ncbi:MAG: DNA recombination protein RmuC [Planctomycetota bacterium]